MGKAGVASLRYDLGGHGMSEDRQEDSLLTATSVAARGVLLLQRAAAPAPDRDRCLRNYRGEYLKPPRRGWLRRTWGMTVSRLAAL